jgi:hypothetical protein
MTCNIGKIERIIRGVAGATVIAWGVMDQNWFGAVGVILLGTAAIGCALLTHCLVLTPGVKSTTIKKVFSCYTTSLICSMEYL